MQKSNPSQRTPFWFLASLLIIATPDAILAAFGDIDTGFSAAVDSPYVFSVVQPNGMILLGGQFSAVNGTTRHRLARVFSDGSLDASFDPDVGPTGSHVDSMVVQPDSRIVVCGFISSIGGVPTRMLVRLNTNGTLDTNFKGPVLNVNNINAEADALECDAAGRIVFGGSFTEVDGTNVSNLGRVASNGTPDFAFSTNTHASQVNIMAMQADQKIIVGGGGGVARYNTNGTRDTGFSNAVSGAAVYALAVQPDGNILVGGNIGATNLIRVNPNGERDTSFHGPGLSGSLRCIALQADGKIIVGGGFYIDGIPRPLARLNTNGTLDWVWTNSVLQNVYSLALQGDGKVLMVGTFTARLENDSATQTLTVPDASRVRWMRGGSSPEAVRVTFELSTDSGATWNYLGPGTRIAGGWELTGLALPDHGRIRAGAQISSSGTPPGFSGRCSFGLVEATADFSGLFQGDRPSLQIQTTDGASSLEWRTNFPDYVAQANWFVTNMNGWIDLTNVPGTNGAYFSIPISTTNEARFFRLRSLP